MNTPKVPLPFSIRTYSIKALQKLNTDVYGAVNARDFEISDMACRLMRYNSRVSLWVRKQETDMLGYHLCVMLSWICGLANRLHIDISQALMDSCGADACFADAPFSELQIAFSARHPATQLPSAALCLSEKTQAIASALEYYRTTHAEEHFRDATHRIAQTVEALCVVSSKLGVHLSEELQRHFSYGCSKCRSVPCLCGFRADKVH
ncbi:MAG: hypothetical protein Q7R88_00325 [bacterium]|nr:hypothetical protein [bacterium]